MRVLVSGYYGFGNSGDEALLGVLVEALQTRLGLGGDAICIMSRSPRETAHRHGVRAIPRSSPWSIRRELGTCNLFISGGGGLIQDQTSRRSAAYYLGLLSWAQRHVPTVMLGQGIGPLNSGIVQHWAHRTLPRTQAALVRDEASVRLLRRWGMAPDRLFRGADLTFLRWMADSPHDAPCQAVRETMGHADSDQAHRPYALLALRGRDVDACTHRLSRAIRDLAEGHQLRPALMAMHPDEDRAPLERLAKLTSGSTPVLDPSSVDTQETLRCFRGADMVIGSRLHALIFAMLVRRPCLAIGSERKITRLVRDVAESGGPPIPQLPLGARPGRPLYLAAAVDCVSAWDDRWEQAVNTLSQRTHQALDRFFERLDDLMEEDAR